MCLTPDHIHNLQSRQAEYYSIAITMGVFMSCPCSLIAWLSISAAHMIAMFLNVIINFVTLCVPHVVDMLPVIRGDIFYHTVRVNRGANGAQGPLLMYILIINYRMENCFLLTNIKAMW